MQTDDKTERAGPTGPGAVFGFDRIFGLTFQAFNNGWRGFAVLIVLGLALSVLLEVAFGILGVGDQLPAEAAATDEQGAAASEIADLEPGQAFGGLLAVMLFFIANLILHFAAVRHAWSWMGPAPGRLREDFALVFRRFWPMLGGGLLFWLCLTIGFMLLIVPGIILAVRWWIWPLAVLREGESGAGALRRSAEITKGRRWTIFLVLLVAMVVTGAVSQAMAALGNLQMLFYLLFMLVNAVLMVLWACLTAALYTALRETEGPGAEARREGAPDTGTA
ncbi:hypothetical protein ACFOGJ_22665 [Marinibaculum pumilum]|uniref:DUF7847 domain-containing protein n=1 Tax=Marinibaculum pumilum TaxID=1766165 RepID=A0ABV7L610_9PROT